MLFSESGENVYLCTPSFLEQEDSASWSPMAKYSLGVGRGRVCERGRVLLEEKRKREKRTPEPACGSQRLASGPPSLIR